MPLLVPSSRFSTQASLWLTLVVVVVTPLAFGAVHPPALVVTTVFLLVALGVLAGLRLRKKRALRIPMTVVPIAAGFALALFSLVPLPRAFRFVLASSLSDMREFMTALLPSTTAGDVWPVLAVAPPEAILALMRFAGALAVVLVVFEHARHRQTRRTIFRFVLAAALLFFFVSLGHKLANVDVIWGLAKAHGNGVLEGPMLNANHNARIAGALSLLCLGRAAVVRDRTEMLWFLFGGTVTGGMVFLSLSRGGALAYVATLLFAAFVFARADGGDEEDAASDSLSSSPSSTRKNRAVVEVGALLAMAVALYVAREAIVGELSTFENETFETSKAILYGPAWALAQQHWVTGVTTGGLASTYASTIPNGTISPNSFSYVENIGLQTVVDHGLIIGPLLIALAVGLLLLFLSRIRHRVGLVALPALVFLVVGDLFDFALETPAGLYLAALCLGILGAHLAESEQNPWRLGQKATIVLFVVVAVPALALSATAVTHNRLAVDARIATVSDDERRGVLEESLAMHPLDGHLAYLLAVDARTKNEKARALDYANRALLMYPGHAGAHVEAARALAATEGKMRQALLEYRLAWEAGSTNRGRLVDEVARRTTDTNERLLAVPNTVLGRQSVCGKIRTEKRVDDAIECFERARETFTGEFAADLVDLYLQKKDGARAKALLDVHAPFPTADDEFAVKHLRAMALADGDDAWSSSKVILPRLRQPRPVLQWRLAEARRKGDFAEALKSVVALRRVTSESAHIDNLDVVEAELLVRIGRKGDALRILRQLVRRRPKDLTASLNTAMLELDLGLVDDASRTHAHAISQAPENARVIDVGIRIDAAKLKRRDARVKDLVDGSLRAE